MKMKSIVSLLLLIVLGMALGLSAQTSALQVPEKGASDAEWDNYYSQLNMLFKMTNGDNNWRKEGVHSGNQVSTVFYNYGTIGQPNNTASLVWPKGSNHDYGFEFGVLLAAEVTDTIGVRRHVISEGLTTGGDKSPSGLPWGFQPLPGYARETQNAIAMNDDPGSWPTSWPNRPEAWDGEWIAEYGLGQETADQESYYIMDDAANAEYAYFPDINDSTRRGLGLEVESRGYQWHQTLAQDCIFFIYNVKNVGSDTLNKVYLGMYGDGHVGGANDYDDDDGAWDTFFDMVYTWDHDFRGKPNAWLPGYLGYKFLESPGEPYDQKDNDDDGLVDESMQDDIDNDGDWDPEIDDVGADGVDADVNRNGIQDGNEVWDEGEGDGYPTHGEPNFDEKDLDEADQIGLTSFAVYEYGTLYPNQDEACWNLMVAGVFDTTFGQTTDNVFQYGSGPIIMAPGDERRFSITLFFGYDKNDLFRSAETVQKIYNEGYRFTKAPEKPTVKAVAGDGRVTLYWDDFAESSRDPIQGYDFAGYSIYRGTDHGMTDAFTITDAQGNPTLYKPIAQFNTAGDGWYGPHPVETENGIHFYMGDDDVTGLKHSWTDTTVTNGQTYYYAVVSFDHGDSTEIPPTECTWEFEEYPAFSGDYLPTVNTAIVTPQAAAAGYQPPSLDGGFVEHDEGPATGSVKVGFLDPAEILENHEYRIVFDDSSSSDTTFSLWDNTVQVSELLPVSIRWQYTAWDNTLTPPVPTDSVQITTIGMSNTNVIPNDQFHFFSADSSVEFAADTSVWELDGPNGRIYIKDTDALPVDQMYYVKYQYYLIANSPYIYGEDMNPFINGLRVTVHNDPLVPDHVNSGWIEDSYSNYKVISARYPNQGVEVPYDFGILVTEDVSSIAYNKKPARFQVMNLTLDEEAPFIFLDNDKDSTLSNGDIVSPVTFVGTRPRGTWQMKFTAPRDSIVLVDSLDENGYAVEDKEGEIIKIPVDTVFVDKRDPRAGDKFVLKIRKPFISKDVYSFTTKRSSIEFGQAKEDLKNIAVVPNPYVGASEFETKPNLQSGRGDRLIYFIHLPAQCTIRIYTLAGELVKSIEHDSANEDGSEAWNMLSKHNMDIAFGIYIYHVDAPGIGEHIGKFAVLK